MVHVQYIEKHLSKNIYDKRIIAFCAEMRISMDINVQQLSNISSTGTEQTGNAYNTIRTDIGIAGTPDSNAGNVNNNDYSILKDLMPGDILSGVIDQIKDSQVLIGFNDGSLLSAHLTGDANVSKGDNITFLVKDISSSQISLKVISTGEQQSMFIDKALEAAGLYSTDENTAMIKELLSLNMPVSSEMLNNMNRLMAQYPDANLNTIANLIRLNIPVTSDNITMFEAYRNFDAQINNQLNSLGLNIYNNINNAAASGDSSVLSDISNIINGMYQSDEAGNEVRSETLGKAFSTDFINDLTDKLSNTSEAGKELAEKISDDSISLKDTINFILNNKSLSDSSSGIVNSASFKQLLGQFITETMRLTPKDVGASDNNPINSFYKRVRKNIEDVESIFKSNNINEELSKSMQDIKSNIDFMNDLNKNMTFFQMPLKFSESEGNGELYVFTNKKALAHSSEEVSAMLHLDMEHLGPIDVYVKLNKKNVSTNFILESEELLDFVYAHIDELNERLEKLGYSTHFEMKVSENVKDDFNFVNDFIEKDIKPENNGQYILDIKA